MTRKPSGEFEFIDWVRRQTPASSRVVLGPGDDTAILRPQGDVPLLATTDMLLEGSCFLLEAGGRAIGRKAMAVNLSDMAAMAGRPTVALVSVGLPRQGGRPLAEELYAGLREWPWHSTPALPEATPIRGWAADHFCDSAGRGNRQSAVRRSGAKPGDWLLVTAPGRQHPWETSDVYTACAKLCACTNLSICMP